MRFRVSVELKKCSCDCQVLLEDIRDTVPFINPLTTKSDKHLISPYKITSDSHVQVMGTKEMIIK